VFQVSESLTGIGKIKITSREIMPVKHLGNEGQEQDDDKKETVFWFEKKEEPLTNFPVR
jgi:hypothetical protein